MRIAVTTLAAVLAATLALGARAAQDEAPLLAFQWDANRGALWLIEVDPLTLAPAGASLALDDKAIPARTSSPDGRLLAFGTWDVARIRIVDRAGLRVVRELRVPPGSVVRGRERVLHGRYAQELVWASPGRLLALVGSCCTAGASITVFDPESGRVVAERAVPGSVEGVARLPDGFVLVLGRGSIGPATLAVVGPDGRVRTAALPRTRVGPRRLPGGGYRVAVRTPGLAVDPEARRAYVVGVDEPVAEVDLRALRVTYHALDRGRTLQARTKDVRGSYRTAAWVGDGVLAVTGWNARAAAGGGPRFEPAGVHLIDTRSWQRRTLAAGSQTFAATRGAIAVPLPTALAVFGPDGAERFRVPGRFGWVQAVNGRAYAWPRSSGGMVVVDLATGTATPSAVARALTLLEP